jgi:hypothetical protein
MLKISIDIKIKINEESIQSNETQEQRGEKLEEFLLNYLNEEWCYKVCYISKITNRITKIKSVTRNFYTIQHMCKHYHAPLSSFSSNTLLSSFASNCDTPPQAEL